MEIENLGKTPISEEQPCGIDVSYEPSFEALSEEIKKMGSPTAAGGIDWGNVIKLSVEILGGQSKNFLSACYLSIALLKTEKMPGFAKGVTILKDLIDNFWDTMYPPKKRMRARKNAVEWWQEKTEAALAEMEPEAWDQEASDAFLADLRAFDALLDENMENAPLLRPLIDKISSFVVAPEEEPGPEPAALSGEETPDRMPASAGKPAPARSAPPAPPTEIPEDDPGKLLSSGLDYLKKAATLLLQHDPFSTVAFRLNRLVAWLPVDSLPPDTDGVTLLPPPDAQAVTALAAMCQSGRWRELLGESEAKVRQYLFWLDLSRYVSESLKNLGHPVTSELIANETYLYTMRLPGLEKLAFSDGTPFADDDTREWLKEIAGKEGGDTNSAFAGAADQLISAQLAECRKMIKENRLAEAIANVHDRIAQAQTVRERFLWEIGLCRILTRSKKAPLAASYMEKIINTLDNYKVETWDPAFAAEALMAAIQALKLQKGDDNKDTLQMLIKRLSIVAPVKALDMV